MEIKKAESRSSGMKRDKLKDYDIMDIEAMDDERLEKSESGKIQTTRVYIKSEADKVIADLEESHKKEVEQLLMEIVELKNRIAPKQSDKTLQERLNEVCKKHAVSTLQDLDWAFCMTEARLEDYTKLAAQLHESVEKMLQYKVLYKEKCRDINTQERFFAMNVAHQKYKRCLNNAWWCLREEFFAEDCRCEHWVDWAIKWHKRWLKIAEQFKEAK